MATISGQVQTLNAGALSEDVRNIIHNTDPTMTPLYTMGMKRPRKAIATLHEWPIHTYDAVATNAHVEGANAPTASSQSVEKLNSRCQLKMKQVTVSDTVRAVKGYGRADELSFKLTEAGMAIKRDCEFAVASSQAGVTGTSGTAAQMKGLVTQAGTTVSDKVASSTALRDLTLPRINKVVSAMAANTGGVQNFKVIANTSQLDKINDLYVTGNVNRYVDGDGASVSTGMTLVRTQYGKLNLMLDNFISNNDILFVDPQYISYATLIPMETKELATSGSGENYLIQEQGTICALAPNRLGAINRLSV